MADEPKIARRITSENVDPNMPAARVIAKFGGLSAFCEVCGFATSTAWRWMRGGFIPMKRGKNMDLSYPAFILAKAKERGITLEPADFIEQEPEPEAA